MVNEKFGLQTARLSLFVTLLLAASASTALAQNPPPAPTPAVQNSYTWDQIKTKFEATNPSLKADALNVDEMKAQEMERNLLFNLRSSFIQTMQAKATLNLTREELDYYDHIIDISRERFKAGDLAQIDLDRIELQRVQYESDLQTAEVNLRTSKIQLLQLLNDRTPVDQFDIQGSFDFSDQL